MCKILLAQIILGVGAGRGGRLLPYYSSKMRIFKMPPSLPVCSHFVMTYTVPNLLIYYILSNLLFQNLINKQKINHIGLRHVKKHWSLILACREQFLFSRWNQNGYTFFTPRMATQYLLKVTEFTYKTCTKLEKPEFYRKKFLFNI